MNNQPEVPDYLKINTQDVIKAYQKQVNDMLYNEIVMQQQINQMEATIKNLHNKLSANGIEDTNNSKDSKQQDVKLNK